MDLIAVVQQQHQHQQIKDRQVEHRLVEIMVEIHLEDIPIEKEVLHTPVIMADKI